MIPPRLGTRIGLFRLATIRSVNPNGTVRIGLEEGNLAGPINEYNVSCPAAWAGPEGEFLGGCPRVGSSVIVSQGQGGEWFIVNFVPSDNVFSSSFISNDSTRMSSLRPGRILLQTKTGNKLFVDPNIGTHIGDDDKFLHIDSGRSIISNNFNSNFSFTESSRSLKQIIKRDLAANLTRDVLGATLESQGYDDSLFSVGLDPSVATSSRTIGNIVRNPPLVENREIVYEFANSFAIANDAVESDLTKQGSTEAFEPSVSRRNMRSDAFSLSLEHPNHLMETIKGTAVDAFGNILDINRSILPIGKIESLSLQKSRDAFDKIKAQHRKAIAYHFEINVKKGSADTTIQPPPDITDTANYARARSRLLLDIDKEGQFKLNIPASSEIGNIPLLTRYENYSVIEGKRNPKETNPNEFVRNTENKEIFLENFAGKPSVKLSASDDTLDGHAAPIDVNTDKPIELGTAFHDITQTCVTFTENSPFFQQSPIGSDIVPYYSDHHLNKGDFVPFPKIVSDTIIVSGPDANAGGRSGTISLDGFVSLNIGANTIDRQSMWIDTAGGIVANIGRDKQGISYAANLDGDMLIQVGGEGIGNSFDTRFATENDGVKFGNVQIHVITSNGVAIFRINEKGIDLSSPGAVTISCQQDLLLKSNSNIIMDAPNIMTHGESSKRMINKFPANSI